MKKRVRSQPSNPFYSNEPAVARNLIADQSMSPSASLANTPGKVVDKKPGRLSGIAGFESKTRPGKGISTPSSKVGASPLRSSGHPKAHRIGQISKLKGI